MALVPLKVSELLLVNSPSSVIANQGDSFNGVAMGEFNECDGHHDGGSAQPSNAMHSKALGVGVARFLEKGVFHKPEPPVNEFS